MLKVSLLLSNYAIILLCPIITKSYYAGIISANRIMHTHARVYNIYLTTLTNTFLAGN